MGHLSSIVLPDISIHYILLSHSVLTTVLQNFVRRCTLGELLQGKQLKVGHVGKTLFFRSVDQPCILPRNQGSLW